MTTFTTEDRLNVIPSKEPIPFAGWMDTMDDIVTMLREQIHAQQSEMMRLNERIRYLESLVYTQGDK